MPVVSRVKKPLKCDPSLAYARNVSVEGLHMTLERKKECRDTKLWPVCLFCWVCSFVFILKASGQTQKICK